MKYFALTAVLVGSLALGGCGWLESHRVHPPAANPIDVTITATPRPATKAETKLLKTELLKRRGITADADGYICRPRRVGTGQAKPVGVPRSGDVPRVGGQPLLIVK